MTRWLTLTLLVLGLASPASALERGWFQGVLTTTPAVRSVTPGEHVYWLSDSTTTVPHTPTARDTLDASACNYVSTEWCLLPTVNDQSATPAVIFLYGASNSAGTATLTPYDADVDGGGVDHIGLSGDCGDDGDDTATAVNNSKWYAWSLTKPYLVVKQTVALDSGDLIVLSLHCH